MYKYLFLLLIVFLNSCTSDEEPYFNMALGNIEFGWEQSSKDVTIRTNSEWQIISETPNWMSISTRSVGKDETVLCITVDENHTDEVRYCELIIASSSPTNSTLVISQSIKERLAFVGEKDYVVEALDTTLHISIQRNVNYNVIIDQEAAEWIVIGDKGENLTDKNNSNKGGKNKLSLRIKANDQKVKRSASVIINNTICELSDTIFITQKEGKELHLDGKYMLIQQATKGKTSLVIMGDGFTKSDLSIGGRYETLMREAQEHFFSIEPYKSYRDYFNVYMVIAESEEAGVGESGGFSTINNKFGTTFGSGTEINCNDERVFEYAQKVEELPDDKPLTVIVVLNSTKYAGTAYLYGNGNSIALCPMSEKEPPNDFEGVVHHEAGGHGFGFLCDEYVYYEKEMPDSRKKDIQEWQKYGFQMNLDFTDNTSTILWKDFIGVEKYQEVGAYEGGYEYQYGVWRCEENSCMNNNIPYFNVQSRLSIVKRIMELSGKQFSIQDFIEADNVTAPEVDSRSVDTRSFKPLGEPKWIKTK